MDWVRRPVSAAEAEYKFALTIMEQVSGLQKVTPFPVLTTMVKTKVPMISGRT